MKRLCNTCTLLMVFFLAASCTAQEIEIENVPDEALTDIELGVFGQTYVLNGAMNPFYLRGDFDGDGKPDYAFWIKTKATSEVGIALWLTSQRKLVVLGAGKPFNIGGCKRDESEFPKYLESIWEKTS